MNSRTSPRIGVLGDDLTGVNAVLAEAAGLGMRCSVTAAADPVRPDGADVWGIDLDSRESGGPDAVAAATAQISRLRAWGAEHVLVKIDSLWRGDPAAMIAAARADATPVIVSGAAPEPLPDTVLIAQANPFLAASEIRAYHRAGTRVWVGGVGLLTVLLWAELADPALLAAVVGSFQPNVKAQVAALEGFGSAVLKLTADGMEARLASAWASRQPFVIQTVADHGLAGHCAAEAAFRRCAELLAPHLAGQVFGLILTGGHTASVVLAALGVRRMDLVGPSAVDGAPLLRARTPSLAKGLIATKPGHFGGPDALVRMAIQLQLRTARGDPQV